MERYIDKDPFGTSTGISQEIKAFYDKNVDCFTVHYRVDEFEYKPQSPVTTPLSSKGGKIARRNYAQAICSLK